MSRRDVMIRCPHGTLFALFSFFLFFFSFRLSIFADAEIARLLTIIMCFGI